VIHEAGVEAAEGVDCATATHCRKLGAGRTVIALEAVFGSSLFTRDHRA